MRAELYRPDAPDRIVAVARWTDGDVELDILVGSVEGLDRLLRRTPILIPGGFPKQLGAAGDTLVQPGTLDWFRAAMVSRAPALGLAARVIADDVRNGWDPASNYRTFEEQEERLAGDR